MITRMPNPPGQNLGPTPPQESGESGMELVRQVLRLMKGRWLWAIVLGVVFAAGGAFGGWKAVGEPNYRSRGNIHIKPTSQKVLYNVDSGMQQAFVNYVQTQVELMTNRRVIDLAMQSDYWKSTGRGRGEEEVIDFMKRLKVRRNESGEMIEITFVHPEQRVAKNAVKAIVNSYKTIYEERDVRGEAEIMRLLEDRKNRLNSDLKGMRDRILQIASEAGSDQLDQNYQFKMQELHKVESELRQAQVTLAYMQATVSPENKNGAKEPAKEGKDKDAPDAAGNALDGSAAAAAGAREPAPVKTDSGDQSATTAPAAGKDKKEAAAPSFDGSVGAADITKVDPDAEQLTVEDIGRRDQMMANLLGQKSLLEREINEKGATLGPEHRLMLALKTQLSVIEQSVAERADTVRGLLKTPGAAAGVNTPTGPNQLQLVAARVYQLQDLFNKLNEETRNLGQRRLNIERLKEEATECDRQLSETKLRIDQLNVEAPLRVSGRMEIIGDGDDVLPVDSNRLNLTIAAGAAGLMLGFVLVGLLGLIDQRFDSPEDAHSRFGRTTILGVLPELPDDLADAEQARMAAHAVHYIRTMLQLGINRHGQRLLSITSAQAGDGKTSLSLSLGYSFAATGVRTLLIDSDMTAGTLSKRVRAMVPRKLGEILMRDGLIGSEQLEQALLLASGNGRRLGEILVELGSLTPEQLQRALDVQEKTHLGLPDVLGGEDLMKCVFSAGVPNLHILPIGNARGIDSARFSPEQAQYLLNQARDKFDIVLIDTAPVLGGLESSMICAEADATVLVVSRGTQRMAVTRALDQLRNIQATLAGIVFNRAETREFARYNQSTSAQSLLYREVAEESEKKNAADGRSRFGPMVTAVAAVNKNGSNGSNGAAGN